MIHMILSVYSFLVVNLSANMQDPDCPYISESERENDSSGKHILLPAYFQRTTLLLTDITLLKRAQRRVVRKI